LPLLTPDVPPLKGLSINPAAYPALKRWAIMSPSRNAGLDCWLSTLIGRPCGC